MFHLDRRRAIFFALLFAVSFPLVAGCSGAGPRRGQGGGSTADYGLPDSLAELVRDSEAIVVAEYSEISDAGEITLLVIPTPPTPITPGPAVVTTTLLVTELTVESILKSDGEVTTTENITYTMGGPLPSGTAEHEDDADLDWPHVWPEDTEFIMFITRREGGNYIVSGGWCGRILTGGSEVTCSDGDRTVMPFMSGVDRDDFISAIQTEVASPSDTETPYPWPTFTDEPPLPTEIP